MTVLPLKSDSFTVVPSWSRPVKSGALSPGLSMAPPRGWVSSSALANDLGGERLQCVPVVRALAERDAEPRAAERPELVDHRVRVLDQPAQVPRAGGAVAAPPEVALPLGLAPRRARGVGAEVEAEVHRAHDRLRIAPLGLAPPVQHVTLVLPVLGADVGAVPAVGELGRRPERALLAPPADPDGD